MVERREFMKVFSMAGLSGTLLPGVLWAQSEGKVAISKEMIDHAAKIAGVCDPRRVQSHDASKSQRSCQRLQRDF